VITGDAEARRNIIKNHHDLPTYGHPGISRTTDLVAKYHWWPNLATVLRSVDRSVRLGRLGVCPECQMAEVGKRLDYNGVRITERWINTQGESACQALKGKGRKGLYKVFQPKRMRCRDSTKYAQRGCIGEVAEALQSIQLGPSDTRSQSYRLLAKLSSLIY
jgi:hypothetical protein